MADVSSGGVRRRGGRKVVPLYAAQQSPAERMAYNKNRILQKHLQFHLESLRKNRRSWLFQTHMEASKYRRRAEHLHDLLSPHLSLTSHPPHTDRGTLPYRDVTSARDVSPGGRRTRQQRPATSVQFRISDHRDGRPKTAAPPLPRPGTTGTCEGGGKPLLFKVRDNRVTTASSSDDEGADSDADSSVRESCDSVDNSNHGTVRIVSAQDRPGSTPDTGVPSSGPGHSNGTGQRTVKKTLRTQSAFHRTPQSTLLQTPSLFHGTPGNRDRTGKGKTETQRHGSHGHRNRIREGQGSTIFTARQRAHTALGTSRGHLKSAAETSRGGGWGGHGEGVGSRAGPRDANYIRYVLSVERDKYEMNQMKVRNYLQSLTI